MGWFDRFRRRSADAEQLALVRQAVDQDVAAYAEELQRLAAAVGTQDLDAEGRADRERADAAYETVRAAVPTIAAPAEVGAITARLREGWLASARLQARIAGEPVPKRRPPCFFDPAHGPSVDDATWTPPPATIPRRVPTCARDAESLTAGAEPAVREVAVDGQRSAPYWRAGAGFVPWVVGYFDSFDLLPVPFAGTPVGAALTGSQLKSWVSDDYDGLDPPGGGVDPTGGSNWPVGVFGG